MVNKLTFFYFITSVHNQLSLLEMNAENNYIVELLIFCVYFSQNRMKQIMMYCFTAVKHRLATKLGYFDLYGFDFMVDEEMKVKWHHLYSMF